MRTVAPAKINWTLEVLGRRDDGYHEIKSVMQTIDLCDEVSGEKSSSSIFETTQGEPLSENDLMVRAARALEEQVRRPLPAYIRVEKRIPAASGLGGGSSDAAAVMRLLNVLYELGLSAEELASVGATVGSDVPFFVYGGTALVQGRGEKVTPLPDAEERWLVIVVPQMDMAGKTRRMYGELTKADFTDGSLTQKAVAALSIGAPLDEDTGYNVFERRAYDIFEGLRQLSDDLFIEGLTPFRLVGAGPAIFACWADPSQAENVAASAEALAADTGLVDPTGYMTVETFVIRTLGMREATLLQDLPAGPPR